MLCSKNLDLLLELFEDDAIVYEPISKGGVLNGIGDITPFLKAICRNSGFLFGENSYKIKDIKYAPSSSSSNIPKVLLTLHGRLNYQLYFEFGMSTLQVDRKTIRKIKKLRIDVPLGKQTRIES